MLAIEKDHKAIKVITAGCIAFSLGLTGAAAYLNSAFEHQNLVFNKQQALKQSSDEKKAETASAASASSGASSDGSSQGSGIQQVQPTSSWNTRPASNGTNVGSVTIAPPSAPAPLPQAPAPVSVPTEPVIPTPINPPAPEPIVTLPSVPVIVIPPLLGQ